MLPFQGSGGPWFCTFTGAYAAGLCFLRPFGPGCEAKAPFARWNRNHLLYVFLLLSSWRSIANSINRSINLGYSNPLAAHSFGYMLIAVNPGIVLISFK